LIQTKLHPAVHCTELRAFTGGSDEDTPFAIYRDAANDLPKNIASSHLLLKNTSEEQCKGYSEYTAVRETHEVEQGDGTEKQCMDTTDIKDRPIRLCPDSMKQGDVLD
jgi:hypothetical protein